MRISDWSSDVCSSDLEDAVDAVDAVGGEALAQALDDGNAAGHRGLVADGAADALGQSGKRGAVVREQRLVGGDHMAPGAQRGLHDLPGGVLDRKSTRLNSSH